MIVKGAKALGTAVIASLLLTAVAASDTPNHKHSVAVIIGNKAYSKPTPMPTATPTP